MTLQAIKRELTSIDDLILALKADGGYRYRQLVKVSDKELKDFIKTAEHRLRYLTIRICVAESFISDMKMLPDYEVVLQSTLASLREKH